MKKVLIVGLVLSLFLLSGCTFQHGTSRDIVQGFDKGILWYHAYLKNDHKTAYCFDNPYWTDILNVAQRSQKEVIVTYEIYALRGKLCMSGEGYESVVITNVEFA